MKNLFIILLFLLSINSFSQSDTIYAKKDVINYKKKMHNLKYGQNLILKIDNFNPFYSKAQVVNKPIDYEFSTEQFKKIDLKEEILKMDATTEKSENRILKSAKNSDPYIGLNKSLFDLNKTKEYKEFTLSTFSTDLERNQPKNIKKLDSLNSILFKQNEEMLKLKDEVIALGKLNKEQEEEIKNLTEVKTAKAEFLKDFENFQTAFEKINNYSSINAILTNQIKETGIFVNDINSFKQKAETTVIAFGIKEIAKAKKDIVKQVEIINDLYTNLNFNYQKINQILKKREFEFKGELKDGKNILTVTNLKASLELKYFFEDEMKKIKSINDSITLPKNKQKIINETFKGCDLYSEIMNQKYETFLSSDFIYNDKADIDFQLKNDKSEILLKYPTIKVKTYNQIKINGSAGYFLNFIGDEVFEPFKVPQIGTNPDKNTYIRASNKNSIKHSLGGLLHAYYNFIPSFAMGISAGLSLNDDANASFYTGCSFFLTESNRLVITSGVSFVKIDKLKTIDLYKDTSGNYYLPDENYQIQYDKVYKPSFFIGITYNIF